MNFKIFVTSKFILDTYNKVVNKNGHPERGKGDIFLP